MSEVRETVQAKIPATEPAEERETEVYTAPSDMLIANVVYTPAGDVPCYRRMYTSQEVCCDKACFRLLCTGVG